MATYTRNIGDALNARSNFAYGDIPAPPGPPAVLKRPPVIIFFPFPVMIDCCCPRPMVSCVQVSADGNMYVPAKTALGTKGER